MLGRRSVPHYASGRRPRRLRTVTILASVRPWIGTATPRASSCAFLLRCIEEAAGLPPPHEFQEPRELRGADRAALFRIGGLQDAVAALKRMQAPFVDWSGKAERQSFEVPTLPLFVHQRLSTAAIIKTLEGHRKRPDQAEMSALYADPQMPLSKQVDAYHHLNKWVNRLILGDLLVVMNSLLRFEGLGGQVQMIYIDPPYGVKFGSNFQPFVRKRDVTHNDDADMTREPEMVQAYRDTWKLGLHSYLTYMRDRLLLARDLLTPSGSVFVQISDENLHHVRTLLDEVFTPTNHVAIIPFRKKTMPLGAKHLESICDYILFYARDIDRLNYNQLFMPMSVEGDNHWNYVELPDGTRRKMSREEIDNHGLLPRGSVPFQLVSLYPAGVNEGGLFKVHFRGKDYYPPSGNSWFTNPEGMKRLIEANRVEPYEDGETLRYVLKLSDSPYSSLTNMWSDTSAPHRKSYVVQTSEKVVQRCMLMTTDPGDLVLDPTCGSGTTAHVAELWGRRWITIDTSRVPLAIARQRILAATYPWFKLRDCQAGPANGFTYSRRQNRRGEEVGGIIPYISKGSIANREPEGELVIVDRPDEDDAITRISGPFVVEATLPTPQQLSEQDASVQPQDSPSDHIARMIEVLRHSPSIALPGNRKVTLKSIRRPGRSLSLSAEAQVDLDTGNAVPLDAAHEQNGGPPSPRSVAILFGPADGPVTTKAVLDAAKEANVKGYSHLYIIGFAITAEARAEIDAGEDVLGLPATFVAATMDLQMGDLLKNQRSSQIFSVCGAPDVHVVQLDELAEDGTPRWQVTLHGLDVFDPVTMQSHHAAGNDVPCWMLDTAYNGMVFHADQVFFPKTSAWDSLRKALRATHDDAVWEHLAGDTSAPFTAAVGTDIAVKVIDERGNELPVIRRLN